MLQWCGEYVRKLFESVAKKPTAFFPAVLVPLLKNIMCDGLNGFCICLQCFDLFIQFNE